MGVGVRGSKNVDGPKAEGPVSGVTWARTDKGLNVEEIVDNLKVVPRIGALGSSRIRATHYKERFLPDSKKDVD